MLCVTPFERTLTPMQVVARAVGDMRRSYLDRDAALSRQVLDLWEDEEVVPSHLNISVSFDSHTSARSPAAHC